MQGALRIRRAAVVEAASLSELAMRSKALWGYDARFMAMCRDELTVQPAAIESGEVWVAESDGMVVGLLELVPDDGVEIQSADVRLIFVEPAHVRSGIGAALWRHAEARARVLGAATLTLDADPYAVPFYERMGMSVVGESPSGSIPGRMLPRLEKSLCASDELRRVAGGKQ
jgi:GNAT superfamily N-acetyltransferase